MAPPAGRFFTALGVAIRAQGVEVGLATSRVARPFRGLQGKGGALGQAKAAAAPGVRPGAAERGTAAPVLGREKVPQGPTAGPVARRGSGAREVDAGRPKGAASRDSKMPRGGRALPRLSITSQVAQPEPTAPGQGVIGALIATIGEAAKGPQAPRGVRPTNRIVVASQGLARVQRGRGAGPAYTVAGAIVRASLEVAAGSSGACKGGAKGLRPAPGRPEEEGAQPLTGGAETARFAPCGLQRPAAQRGAGLSVAPGAHN